MDTPSAELSNAVYISNGKTALVQTSGGGGSASDTNTKAGESRFVHVYWYLGGR